MNDLPELPKELRDQLIAGRVVPFLGAGIGLPCGLPDWRQLLERVLGWGMANGVEIQHAEQIGQAIAAGDLDSPSHALSQALGDRLHDALSSILANPAVAATPLHRLLASVAWPIVLTTNFDRLLAQSFSPHLEPITWQDSEQLGHALRTGQKHLMLAHGWIGRPDSIVLSPAQYRESFHSPAQQLYLRILLSQYTLLFIGCSLRDPDIKYFLDESRQAFGIGATPHYALLPRTDTDEVRKDHFRDNFGIHILTYQPTDGHPEVATFVRRVVDILPPELLFDPSVKSQNLTVAKLALSTLPPDAYLQKFTAVARDVAASGFARTAWTALRAEIGRRVDAAPSVRLAATIELANLLREDHDYDYAANVLREATALCDQPEIPQQLLVAFAKTAIATYIDAYYLGDAIKLYTERERYGLAQLDVDEITRALDQARLLDSGELPLSSPVTAQEIALWCESQARTDDVDLALARLTASAQLSRDEGDYLGSLHLENTRAHLLYLSLRLDEAWQIFEKYIVPHKHCLSLESWAEVLENQSLVGFSLGKHVDTDELKVNRDVRTKSKDRAEGPADLLRAESASRDQKHYDSLPPLWRELRRCCSGLSWGSLQRAHHRFASEAYAAGWIQESTHHAIMGNNSACLEQLGELLIRRREPSLIGTSIQYILTNCKLPHHIIIAAKFIAQVGDVIADADMAAIVRLLKRDVFIEGILDRGAEECISAAWDALARLAFRLSPNESADLLRIAQGSRILATRNYARKSQLTAIRMLLGRVGEYALGDLTPTLIAIASDAWDYDYEAALRALEVVAQKSVEAKTSIRETLFPRGPIDTHRAAYAIAFGAEIDGGQFSKMVSKTAEELPKQVVCGDQDIFSLSTYGTIQVMLPDSRAIVVQNLGGYSELRLITVHQNALQDEQVRELVSAVLCALANPCNNRPNRLMLIDFLFAIRSRLAPDLARTVCQIVYPRAIGNASPSPTDSPKPRTTDRFQINAPSEAEEEARASRLIIGLCNSLLSDGDPSWRALALRGLLHPAFEVRYYTCTAVHEANECGLDLGAALATAAFDSDPRVAQVAIHALTLLLRRGMLRSQISLLTTVSARSLNVENPVVRALAARLAHYLRRVAEASQSPTLEEVLSVLSGDVSWQVRQAAKWGDTSDVGNDVGSQD